MKVTVLSDNIGAGSLSGEWGLSLHISFRGKSYLLDAGGSGLFARNAEALGIDLASVDCAVLSHAHYDHASGLVTFFEINQHASCYISPYARESCYSRRRLAGRYIGLPKGMLEKYESRFKQFCGVTAIDRDVWLVPHSTPGLEKVGRASHLYVRRGLWSYADDFAHEQTLVMRESGGLVVMNSCSHAGADVIVDEVRRAFPGEPVMAYVGGLHLFRRPDDEVRSVARKIADAGCGMIFTGHCTGERAFLILKEALGAGVVQFRCGMEMSF